ncbi:MAG: glycosyltransferase family 4 protein [Catalinimonas sp.]
MRLVLVHQHFRTPERGGGLRTWHLVRALAAAGHTVDVVAGHNASQTRREVLPDACERVRLHYLPVPYDQRMSAAARQASFARFLLRAFGEVGRMRRPDIVYTVTTPLTVPLVGLALHRLHRTPYVIEIGDLWPDVPIALGFVRSPLIRTALRRMERTIYRRAALIVPYSPPIGAAVAERAPDVPQLIVPNVADCRFFEPPARERGADAPGAFTVGYLGAAGFANHLDYLLDAAEACRRALPDVRFVLMAEGAEWPQLRARAAMLPNVRVVPFAGREGVRKWIRTVDACYVSFRPEPVLATGCPNKFFDALAAGKLSILNFGGWLRTLVEQHRCGLYVDPERPADFPIQLSPFLKDRELLLTYQRNARQLAERRFDVPVLMTPLVEALSRVAAERKEAPGYSSGL